MKTNDLVLLSHLIGGGDVRVFNFSALYDAICQQQAGQHAAAEVRLGVLRDKGLLNLRDGRHPLISPEVSDLVINEIVRAESRLRDTLDELEMLYTLRLLGHVRPTIITASLDDVIEAALSASVIRKPSDWVVILMLCAEQGKPLTPTALINALKANRKVPRALIPYRQGLVQADFMMTRSNYWPSWKKPSTMRDENFKQKCRIAEVVFPLINVLQ